MKPDLGAMKGEPPVFAEYGDGEDHIGARRVRRAFRFCVVAVLLFAAMLWFSEYYLRYDAPERLYIASLTQEPESGRVLLQSAVKMDVETREKPTPKYVAALAERAADDDILSTYDKAYKLDPDDSFVAIRYGCQLFMKGKYKEARERFREANTQTPDNALPGYLEAAAFQWAAPDTTDIAESLALVARTNSSGDKVTFPKPSWALSVLPQSGAWYAKLRREAVDECCAPLYQYADLVISRAVKDIDAGQAQYWDSWLKTIQEMGERLAASPDLGTIQTTAGIQIQLNAIEQRSRIQQIKTGAADTDLIEQGLQLRTGMERLNDFERNRDTRIAADRQAYLFPLGLCFVSVFVLFGLFLVIYLVAKMARAGRKCWSIPHSRTAKAVLCAGCVLLFLILCLTAILQRHDPTRGAWQEWTAYAWVSILVGLAVFGGFYPSLRLPSARKAAQRAADESLLPAARKARRIAGLSLMRRYYGVMLGLLLCAIACWVVLFRVFTSLYPWQVNLLTSGLSQEEFQVVRDVLALLHTTPRV